MGFRLSFLLQPIAFWMPKELTEEESELFEIYDYHTPGWLGGWSILQKNLSSFYEKYKADTDQICQDMNIPWRDCSQLFPRNGWLFCDYAHLTDTGQTAAAEIILTTCEGQA